MNGLMDVVKKSSDIYNNQKHDLRLQARLILEVLTAFSDVHEYEPIPCHRPFHARIQYDNHSSALATTFNDNETRTFHS
jgi:hypothetical protein